MRDLAITVELVNAKQAQAELGLVEQGLKAVENAAKPAGQSLDELMGPKLSAQLKEAKAQADAYTESLKKQTTETQKANPAMAGLLGIVRQYAAPAAIGIPSRTAATNGSISHSKPKPRIRPRPLCCNSKRASTPSCNALTTSGPTRRST